MNANKKFKTHITLSRFLNCWNQNKTWNFCITPNWKNCYRLSRLDMITFRPFSLICPVVHKRIGGERFIPNIISCKRVWRKLEILVVMRLNYLFGFLIWRIGNKLGFNFQLFCTRWCSNYFWREIIREAILNFFAEKVARGNAVQMLLNFPAKSLSI